MTFLNAAWQHHKSGAYRCTRREGQQTGGNGSISGQERCCATISDWKMQRRTGGNERRRGKERRERGAPLARATRCKTRCAPASLAHYRYSQRRGGDGRVRRRHETESWTAPWRQWPGSMYQCMLMALAASVTPVAKMAKSGESAM